MLLPLGHPILITRPHRDSRIMIHEGEGCKKWTDVTRFASLGPPTSNTFSFPTYAPLQMRAPLCCTGMPLACRFANLCPYLALQ